VRAASDLGAAEQQNWQWTMIFKIMAFLAAAIPIVLLLRSIFFRRTTRINDSLREFKKHADLAVSILLLGIGGAVILAVGKLAWTWWTAP
jgi:hypothetical protein